MHILYLFAYLQLHSLYLEKISLLETEAEGNLLLAQCMGFFLRVFF